MSDGSPDLRGLGGWLILVGIGVVLSPFQVVFLLSTTFYPIFTDGSWELLTKPTSEFFTPHLAQILVFEISINLIILTASLHLIFLFFRKQRNFPKVYIGIVVFNFTFILLDAWLATIVFPEKPVFDDAGTLQELARSAPALLIWTPYMLLSKRVKATFVEPRDLD